MIKGYMQVDLNNELAVRYMEVALKSFERVSDIFEIEVVQCITPETLLPELINHKKVTHNKDGNPLIMRSPQEIGSLHSNYRMIKRLSEGERFWVLEHDAFLRVNGEDVFRTLMSKWNQFPAAGIGMAFEFYTMWPEVAQKWIDVFLSGVNMGPMGIMHKATDNWSNETQYSKNNIYWPCDRKVDTRWANMTGIGRSCQQAHRDPSKILHSPITQCIDVRYGGTVTDREMTKNSKTGEYDQNILYNKKRHPDVEWITLDD
jgi:hypothetical protein